MMQVRFDKRDFTKELILPALDFKVIRYSKAAIGGPLVAEVEARGEDKDLWALISKLRSPVGIYSTNGKLRWWGYLEEINGTMRALGKPENSLVNIGVTIRDTYNRIAVAYVKLSAANQTKTRGTTAWADDLFSQAAYGIKELLESNSASSAAHAVAARDMKLAQAKFPIPVIDSDSSGDSSATLYLRGWWDTLAWRYYQNTTHLDVDTGEQIKTIIDAKGQFLSGCDLDVWEGAGDTQGSGLEVDQYRNGDDSAYFVITELLESGTASSRRILATVDEYRKARIYAEPAPPLYPHLLTSDGGINDASDNPLDRESCPVGMWARTKDVIPQSTDISALANPSLRFIEIMEYDAVEDKLNPTARGDPDPFKASAMSDG